MLLNGVLPLLLQYWPVVLASLTLGWLLSNKFWKGLNRYPGHWLAGYTNWWRLWDVWGRHHHWNLIRLHREHGDVVRLGPNVLSFADPKAIKIIYGLNKGMVKVSNPHLGVPHSISRDGDEALVWSRYLPLHVVRLLPGSECSCQGPSPPISLLYYK